jgi:hypothetical protein
MTNIEVHGFDLSLGGIAMCDEIKQRLADCDFFKEVNVTVENDHSRNHNNAPRKFFRIFSDNDDEVRHTVKCLESLGIDTELVMLSAFFKNGKYR